MENKKPIFRFKNHVEGWKSLTLGEVSEIKTGPFGSTLHAKDYVESGTPIITTEHFKFGELPDTKLNTPQVSESDYQRLSSYKLIKGDIVFSRVGSVDINALVGDLQNGWLFSGRVLRVRPQVNVDSEYLHYLLETTSVKNDVLSRAVGQTMPSINTEILKNTNITMSIDVSEQKSIGEFLRSVDKIIKIHQQELKTLKKTKQGFLQKMFPKEGDILPEVRFAGFDSNWTSVELGNVGKFVRSSLNTQLTSNDKFIEYSMPAYDDGRKPQIVFGGSMQSSRLKISGDVLLINKLNVRQKRIWLVQGAPENAVASSEFMPYTSENIDLEFLRQLMLTDNITRDLESMSSGTSNSQKRITPTDLLKYNLMLPVDKKEQIKIGEFFKQLDQTIELHEKELEALKETKKAFLQKMFV